MALNTYESYYIAHAALVVLTFVPTVILFFCSFCMVRRRKDPARTGFTYLKAALLFFAAMCFVDVCGYALAVAYSRWQVEVAPYGSYRSDEDSEILRGLFVSQTHVFAVARLWACIADIFILFVITRIGTGVIIAKDGAPDVVGKILKLASYFMAFVLAALALARFAIREKFNSEYYIRALFYFSAGPGPDESLVDDLTKSNQIDFSFQVLVFILSLALVGRSVMVKLQSRAEPRVYPASNFLIAMSMLWLLRSVYGVAALASVVNLSDAKKSKDIQSYWDILDVVFGIWPEFILLCLAFFLGTKKQNGLWSTEQPFMRMGSGQQQTPWGYGYNNQQHQQQPPVQNAWQPQDQQYQQQQQQYQQPQYQQQGQYQQQQYQQYEQPVQQDGYPPQQSYQTSQNYSSYDTTPAQTRSPPPHEDTMGLNHQADGTPPQAQTQPYNEKLH